MFFLANFSQIPYNSCSEYSQKGEIVIRCIGIYVNKAFEAPELKVGVWKDLSHLSVCLNKNGQVYYDKNEGGNSDILHPGEEIELPGNVFVCAFTSSKDLLEWFRSKPGWVEGLASTGSGEDEIPSITLHAALELPRLSGHAV